jgi:hypothetical protein
LSTILEDLEIWNAARVICTGTTALTNGQLRTAEGDATAAPPCELCKDILCSFAASCPQPYLLSQLRLDILIALIEDSFDRGIDSVTRDCSGTGPLSLDDRTNVEILLQESYERGITFAKKKAVEEKKLKRAQAQKAKDYSLKDGTLMK